MPVIFCSLCWRIGQLPTCTPHISCVRLRELRRVHDNQVALIHRGLGEVRSLREELLRFSADSHSVTSLLQLIGLILLIFHHFWRLHPLGPLEVVLETGVFVENFLVTIYHQGRLRLVTLKARGSVFVLHLFELVVEFLDRGGILSPGTGKLLWARRTINDLLSNKIVR